MGFTKDNGVNKGEKYKYQTRKEHVTLRIIDDKSENKSVSNIPIMHKSIQTDPLGSYTGKPLDDEEMPVQDADDL